MGKSLTSATCCLLYSLDGSEVQHQLDVAYVYRAHQQAHGQRLCCATTQTHIGGQCSRAVMKHDTTDILCILQGRPGQPKSSHETHSGRKHRRVRTPMFLHLPCLAT